MYSAPVLRVAFTENLEVSIKGSAERLWCSEMMTCFRDAIPDYAAKVQSLVLSGGLSQIERLDTYRLRSWVWGVTSGLHVGRQDLPDNPRAAESEQVSYANLPYGLAMDHQGLINII
jgi:hypothetical protein